MAKLVCILTLDTEKPLGPQLAAAQGQGFKGRFLARMLGMSDRHVRRLIEMSGFWDRQAVEFRVDDASPQRPDCSGD